MEIPQDYLEILSWLHKFAPKQKEIINAFEDKYIILLIAANGIGKTLLLIWNFLMLLIGAHPIQSGADGHEPKMLPPLNARISAPTWDDNIMKVIVPGINKLLPASQIKKQFTESSRIYYLRNGSTLQLMTYEQMVSQHASRELDLIGHDEQPPRQIWIEDMERMRSAKDGGRCFMGMTQELETSRPITWILDELWESDNPDIAKFTMSKYDLVGYHPNYTEEYFEREKRKYGEDSDEFRVKILGGTVAAGGPVYAKDFRDSLQPKGHIIKYFQIPLKWEFGMAVDSHQRKPIAALWYAKDPNGNIFIIDEAKRLETENKTVREVCQDTFDKKEVGWPIDVRLLGESAFNKDNTKELDYSQAVEFGRWGYTFQPATEKPADARVNATRQYLRSNGSEFPEIRIFEHCTDLRHDLRHVVYEEYKRREEKDPKMKIKDKWKCLPDCLSYICQYEGRFIDTEPEEKSIIETEFLPRFKWGRGLSTGVY